MKPKGGYVLDLNILAVTWKIIYIFPSSEGITFSSVHDCYWTHACDVDRMNQICRQQFVNLHSEPILHQMTSHLSKFLTGEDGFPVIDSCLQEELKMLLESIPQQGDFNLDDVKNSTYFFC